MRRSIRSLALIGGLLCSSLFSAHGALAAPPSAESLFQRFKDYWALPVIQAINPEVLKGMLVPSNDESKAYVTVDGIEKAAWIERVKQRNDWRQKSVIDTISIDSILRLNHGEDSDHVFTVSDGMEGLDPTNPDVAYDPTNHRYLMVWEEETSPGNFSIMGQFRDQTGNPVGAPNLISTARTTQGCFYAAFDTDNGAVSTPTNCPKAANPSVAYNNGRYLITWELKGRADHARNSDASANEAGKNFSNIVAKVVSAENLTPVSPAWQEGILISRVWIASNVGTPAANDSQVQAWAQSLNPDVAPKLGSDGFVVTWQSNKDFIGCVDPNRRNSSSIFARYIDQNFSPTGGASNKPIFAVFTDPSTVTPSCPTLDNVMKAANPRIAYSSNRSDIVIAFEYARASGATKGDIAAKKVSFNNANDANVGNSMAADVVAAAAEGSTFHNPDVASYAQNTLLAYDDGSNVFLKTLTTNAANVAASGEATNVALAGSGAKTEPRIGSNLSVGGTRNPPNAYPERLLIAYRQGDAMKWAITDNTFVVLRGPSAFPVMATANHQAEVASDSNNFFVAWAGMPNGSMIENVFGAVVNTVDDLPAVQLLTPADNAILTQTTVNLTWTAVAGTGIVYDVYLGVGGAAPMIVSTGQAGTSYMINNLTWGTSYQWRVVVRDSLGRTGSSPTRSFSTIPALQAPVLTGPANAGTVAMNSANLTWNAVAGMGIVYDVFEGVGALPGAPVANGIAATNYAVNGLVSQQVHQWKVRVRDMYGRSAESAVWSYTVGNLNMPTAPVLGAQPADNATWAPTRLYLSWSASTDADVGDTVTYDVYFEPVAGAMDPLPMGAVPYRSGISDTSFIIQASTDNRAQYLPNGPHAGTPIYLAANTHYAWKVCANDGRSNPAGVTCSLVRHFNTDNSVVGWWRFDENPAGPLCMGAPMGSGKTVCDYSGNNNHGVPNGGPVWLAPPDPMLLGGALQFDGVNDYVVIPNSLSLNPDSISIMVDMVTNGKVGEQSVIDKRVGGGVGPAGYQLRVQGAAYPLTLNFLITETNGTSHYLTNAGVINNSTRYQILSKFDLVSGEAKSFLNGALIGTTNFGMLNRMIKSNTSLIFADTSLFPNPSMYNFNGAFEEEVLFNKALADEEALNNFSSKIN